MKTVKSTTKKIRPNPLEEVKGRIKTTITLLFGLFTAMNGFAQQYIDIVNAPLNPIAYIENKNQLNLKGDIAFYYDVNEGDIYFDKNGNRVFNLTRTYTDKGKARINEGTYILLDNQKKAVYKENSLLNNKTSYTYYPNGTVSKVEIQGKYPSVATYEYDAKKRVIKKIDKTDAKTTVIVYSYKTVGNHIVIAASQTETKNNQSESRTFEYAYENGILMKFTENGSEDNYTYTYDTKGNWVTQSFRYGTVNRKFYYHSELGQWDKWRWIYKKEGTAYLPYLVIGNRQIKRLIFGANDLDDFTDILFYEPLTATTLVAENVVTTTGLTQDTGGRKISTLKAKNLMYISKKGNVKFLVKGNNKSGNIKQVFVGKIYVVYDANSLLTYWCRDFDKSKKINVFEDLGKDALLWMKNEKNDVYFWQKGEYFRPSGYTLGETLNDGSNLLYKNQKPALVLKDATTAAQNTFYKVVLYSGQAIPKNANPAQSTTMGGSNTAVKDYSKDKITASYNENESLYARKIDNATVYFYQNNKRINQPLHYAIIEDGNNLRLFTTYTKDYYSVYALNDMLPEKLYPLTHRNGVFYLYINQSNGNFSFNYQGKALSSAQYELYKSKGDYTVVKVKSDNTIYLFKSNLTKAAISNSQSKGVLVHFADKSSIFVESGKPTEPTKWKIEKENDKYYLFNSSGSIKYSLSDYEKSINWGIYTIH